MELTSIGRLSDVEVLARTLWAEARSQGETGMTAVACVIQNRAATPEWWGHDIRSVCLAAKQFSCWNRSNPQYRLIGTPSPIRDRAFPLANAIAIGVLDGRLTDITNGADHYYAEYLRPPPKWATGRTPTFTCGSPGSRHFFYHIGP